MNFYTEGGYLSNSLSSFVGFECFDELGSPVSMKAILYYDNVPIDTIKTNSYGQGRFLIKPTSGKRFSCKPIDKQSSAQTFNLPVAKLDIPVLTMNDAIVQDTLRSW
ncbi:hypothetical protein EA772_15365 [Pedobacter sp. G11]|uniref:hypothetical protein n=1 Tax=Pedobacter sp. G11 TaxID=2482728 RepID=UPI000F5D9BE9|nr:hypothetical protein [Pedobacter sp. G11]AZI26652.1 hypothetical protein EA772_15365 [Pedobacter sp. G11]